MSDYFESVDVEEFRPILAFNYPDININVLDFYVLMTIREFARKSRSIKRVVKIKGQKCVNDYMITLPDGYVVVELNTVKVDGVCIEKIHNTCLCNMHKFKYRSGLLTICDFKGCEIEATVIASPSNQSCRIDKDIFDQWSDVIAHGVNSKLMLSNDKRWANKVVARDSLQLFLLGCEEAQEQAQRDGVTDKVYYGTKTARARQVHNSYPSGNYTL